MKVLSESTIYENPLPQLRSRQSAFPYSCQLPDGTIIATFTMGEAFESVDQTSHLAFSHDLGKTFSEPVAMFSDNQGPADFSDSCKITLLPDGRLIALGYAYDRTDKQKPIGNAQTGGLLDDVVFVSYSIDQGASWSKWELIDCFWGPHVEASAWLSVLQSGSWVTPITGFKAWDGSVTGRNSGRILRSDDEGRTWSDETICMYFEDEAISCYEQRLCQLESGKLVCIGWNEHLVEGTLYPNHYTISTDDARSFSRPLSTGIKGQAAGVCAAGKETLLALHAMRRDTDRPGIYASHVDLTDNKWNILAEQMIWEPDRPIVANERMAQTFAFLKFGQPGALRLADGSFLVTFWQEKDCQLITSAIRLSLTD